MKKFLALFAAAILLAGTASAQTIIPGVTPGGSPGGSSGNVQTNNGSGGFAGVGVTGSGSVVEATSPTLVTPNLGTPSAATLTNATGLPPAGITALASGDVVGNATSASASPTDATLTSIIDRAFGSTQGGLLYRSASSWAFIGPGTSGNFLETLGTGANPAWGVPSGGGTGCTIGGSANQVVVNTGTSGCTSSSATLTTGGLYASASPTANNYALSITGASVSSGTTGAGINLTAADTSTSPVDAIAEFFNITCSPCSGGSHYIVDWQVGGVSKFKVDTLGGLTTGGSLSVGANISVTNGAVTIGSTKELFFNGRGVVSSPAAGNIQLGDTDAASPVAQTLGPQNQITTSNTAGQTFTIRGSAGTGTATPAAIQFQTAQNTAGSTTLNGYSTAFKMQLGVPIMPSFTVSTLPSCSTVGAGAFAYVTDSTLTLAAGIGTADSTGGSTNKHRDTCDGTSWIVG